MIIQRRHFPSENRFGCTKCKINVEIIRFSTKAELDSNQQKELLVSAKLSFLKFNALFFRTADPFHVYHIQRVKIRLLSRL